MALRIWPRVVGSGVSRALLTLTQASSEARLASTAYSYRAPGFGLTAAASNAVPSASNKPTADRMGRLSEFPGHGRRAA